MIIVHVPGAKSTAIQDLARCADLTRRGVWIDIVQPSPEEERAVEAAVGMDIPTRAEMAAIELSRRLYKEGDALYMTATVLTKSDTSHPESSAITFILVGSQLITVRYADPVPFRVFSERRDRESQNFSTGPRILGGLVDAMVERLADILENTGLGLDALSLEVFSDGSEAEPPAVAQKPGLQRDFKVILRRIGRFSDLASRARESLVSLGRLLSYFRESERGQGAERELLAHLKIVHADMNSLGDHASFLSNKVAFLLDATLGLINNEQNAIIKIVSVATVVFLPPTLVASIYGMNFHHMPELDWHVGYPMAIAMMVCSAILPYALFKHKRWL